MKNLNELIRPCVRRMKPYSSARDEFQGEASVFLDANENPYNAPFNRYPDPMQWAVKKKIAKLKGVQPEQILLGNGSDEPIDLLMRAFCEPREDNIVAIDPTYGMYHVAAEVNDVEYRKALLNEKFDLDADLLLKVCDRNTKLVYLCSPNNPTGNSLSREAIYKVLRIFQGIVVLDEAYIDFSEHPTFLKELDQFPNLVVLQTFSKAWGSAGIRLGMAFAAPEIIRVLNKIKYPYNVNELTQREALKMLDRREQVKEWVAALLQERVVLTEKLRELPYIKELYPSDSNFILVKVPDANALYDYLIRSGIVIRNRNSVSLCAGCLRITVGTPEENSLLLEALNKYSGI
jgi:histidinol-phosphate aminotransferase